MHRGAPGGRFVTDRNHRGTPPSTPVLPLQPTEMHVLMHARPEQNSFDAFIPTLHANLSLGSAPASVMAYLLRILVAALVICSTVEAGQPIVEQKTPTRSPAAVREATLLSLSGYQGSSTTKNRKPRPERVSLVEQKKPKRSPLAVRTATWHALTGYQGHSTTKKRNIA